MLVAAAVTSAVAHAQTPIRFFVFDGFMRQGPLAFSDGTHITQSDQFFVVGFYEFDLRGYTGDPEPYARIQGFVRPERSGVPNRVIRVSVYEADGVASLDDFFADTQHCCEIQVPTLGHPPGEWFMIDVSLIIRDALAAGITHLGLRLETVGMNWAAEDVSIFLDIGRICPVCTWDWDENGYPDGWDFVQFVEAWYQGDPCADIDGSGGIDIGDIEMFYDVLGRQHC